jgi:cation-transporting ATPase 13A3/4/5
MVKLASTAKYGCQVNRFNLKDSLIDCDNVNSVELVPGDLIEITDQLTMPCDCVVIQGQVIVNEAMLTGESIPVTKLAVPNNASQIYNIDNDRNYTLYAGTNVLQIRRGGNRYA